ncbi:MAG: DNRLRE domain-containing protein, partial [Thermoplasmata archaeon]
MIKIMWFNGRFPNKRVVAVLIIMILLSNFSLFGMISQFSVKNQMDEKYDVDNNIINEPKKENSKDDDSDNPYNLSPKRRATRANNPYLSRNIHPINARDNEGGNPDYLNLDEPAPGDNSKERTGKDGSYAWIECEYGPANIVVGSIINGMTLFMGYHCDADWDLSPGHKGIVWSPLDGGSEHNISDYSVSVSDRDDIFSITNNLPSVNDLNNGLKIRVSGYDSDGAGPDYLFLDYLYFMINYSLPTIVINEIMFNATGSDDYSEWVELFNAGDSAINLTGWNLTDYDGNRFSLTGAGSIPPGGYLVCHLAKSGSSDSKNLYGPITTNISLQPNSTEGNDTYICNDFPATNYGTNPSIRIENAASVFTTLMHFNFSTISEIGLSTSSLYLYHYDGHSSINGTINLYRLNRSWTETGADWNTTDGTNNWTSAGGDYNSTIEYSSLVTAGSYGWSYWDITDLIRGWKNGSYENNGIILVGNAGSGWHLFYSSDYLGDTSLRPKLVLKYNNTKKMLDDSDDLSLVDNCDNIVDYVAWGEDPGLDDDYAVFANQWLEGDFIDTQWLSEGQTLGRDRDSNDTDRKGDWQNASGFADGFGINRGDIWGPSPGERNMDPDLKGPRIRDVLSSPNIQVLDGYVNITCNVTDPDGVSNVWLNITLPDSGYINASMIKDAGFKWYYNDNYTKLGQYTYTIWATDIMENWSASDVLQFEVANRAPTLSSGGVNPPVGYFMSQFNFSVIYTDLDNHSPSNVTVNITNLGVFSLIQLDNSDMIYSDGKLFYINISAIPAGTSYAFHFAAQDIIGQWGDETPVIDAPDILPKSATLTAFDETTKYSDDAILTAILMENSTPVEGENIAFYIDMNDNGFYEASELVGEATTVADGSVSVINTTYLNPGTYNIAAVYIGSGNYDVNTAESILIINVKQASLVNQSEVAEEGESTILKAIMTDESGNLIANEQVTFYLDKNRNEIYEGSELLGLNRTSVIGIASFDYIVNLVPGQYNIWAKYSGSVNYDVIEIEGMLIVQNTGNNPPTILGRIPDQIMLEDSPPRTLSLTPYEADTEDSGSDLKWYITGVDTALYSVTGSNSTNDLLTFIPKENAFGNDEAILWLMDSSGALASQLLWINITPVNDVPYFDPPPPNLHVHYDDPTTDLDDPDPWDFMFYVHDVETTVENLIISTSEPTVDAGSGYAEVIGLKITFHYPQSRVGETIMVTLTIFDGTASAQTI